MKLIGIIAKWLFIVCLPVLLLAATIGLGANSVWLNKYAADKYGVSQALANAGVEMTDAELEQVYAGLVSYYNSSDEYVNFTVTRDGKPISLLTAEEVFHFKDVKGLIWLDYWILLGTLIYALGYAGLILFWRKDRRELARGLLWGSGLTLGLILALVLLDALFGFSRVFYDFHLLFFTNDFWAAGGNMVLLFPEGYFIDAATFGALAMAGAAVVLGGASAVYLRMTKAQTT